MRYDYDALGRLVQATAPDGNGVHYNYDAVGNVTAIRHLTADALDVIDFAPHTGAIGSTVTIFGSGFDTAASGNAVAFNGTAAAVVTATATTLVANVPSGASSGKITVNNALGNATSADDYLVNGMSPAPVIAAFTPQVGTVGAVVTVSGANFQSHVDDNKVTVGGQLAGTIKDASSPTATQLKIHAPSTTASGKIVVTTPFGTAVSSNEFFALPTTVNAADVEFTGRVSVNGPSLSVTTTANGKKAVLLFDAQVGQQLHLIASGGTFASGFTADVYRPDGVKSETLAMTNNKVADFANSLVLGGTYSVILSPAASDKGSVQINVVSDVDATIVLDGTTVVNLTAGQNARYRFTAQAATGYGLAVGPLSFTPSSGSPSLAVTLRKADGTSLATCSFSVAGSCDFDPSSFATTDSYLLDFDPSNLAAASFNAILSTDASGAVPVNGSTATTVTIARAGQNARYNFSGTAGTLVTVLLSGNALDDGNTSTVNGTQVLVFRPGSAVTIGSGTFNTVATGLTLDLTLPDTGNYTIAIKPSGLDSGTVDLQVKAAATGELALDGTTAVNLSAGQNGRFTFTAQAGTGYGLAVTGLTFTPSSGSPSLTATLRKGDGTSLGTCSFMAGGSCDFDPQSFATTGTYLIDFDPSGLAAASFNAVLSSDAGGVVTVDAVGPTVVPIVRAGQNARYTFSGTTAQLVTVVVSNYALDDGNAGTPSSAQVTVFKPSNATNAISTNVINVATGQLTVDLTLPETGSYTVAIKPIGLDTGSINLQVKSYVTAALALDGSTAVSVSAGQNARYSFTAAAGAGYGLAVAGLSFNPSGASPSMTVTLRKADATSLATCSFTASGSCDFDPPSIATTGTYLLDFDPAGLSGASFNAVLSTDASGTVTVEAPDPTTVTIVRAGQNARYKFTGAAGETVSVILNGYTLDDGNAGTPSSAQVTVFKPSSGVSPIGTGTINNSTGTLTLNLTLPEAGNYTVAIKPTGLDSGSINLGVKHP